MRPPLSLKTLEVEMAAGGDVGMGFRCCILGRKFQSGAPRISDCMNLGFRLSETKGWALDSSPAQSLKTGSHNRFLYEALVTGARAPTPASHRSMTSRWSGQTKS